MSSVNTVTSCKCMRAHPCAVHFGSTCRLGTCLIALVRVFYLWRVNGTTSLRHLFRGPPTDHRKHHAEFAAVKAFTMSSQTRDCESGREAIPCFSQLRQTAPLLPWCSVAAGSPLTDPVVSDTRQGPQNPHFRVPGPGDRRVRLTTAPRRTVVVSWDESISAPRSQLINDVLCRGRRHNS